jgi:hypothetical protein
LTNKQEYSQLFERRRLKETINAKRTEKEMKNLKPNKFFYGDSSLTNEFAKQAGAELSCWGTDNVH